MIECRLYFEMLDEIPNTFEFYLVSTEGVEWYDKELDMWHKSTVFYCEQDLISCTSVQYLGEL